MPYLVVCPLEDIAHCAANHHAGDMITLLSPDQNVTRPDIIDPSRHLIVGVNDIIEEQDGLIPPDEQHVASIIRFARKWDQQSPLLIHCWFGISRSPATAMICALALNSDQDDMELALRLRKAAPSATPNYRLIEIADKLLDRNNKLIDATHHIGRGATASQGTPFVLTLQPEQA